MNKINDLERAKLQEYKYYCEVARNAIEANGLTGLDNNKKELDNLLNNIVSPVVYPVKRVLVEEVLLTVYPVNENALRLECKIGLSLDTNSKIKTINMIYKRGQNIFLTANPDFTQTRNCYEQIPARARVIKVR